LKYSRWTWVMFSDNMRQEELFRRHTQYADHPDGRLRPRAVEHLVDPRQQLVLPLIRPVVTRLERGTMLLALEAPNPDVKVIVLPADEAADNNDALSKLAGHDALLHELDPLIPLAGKDPVLAELEEHVASLSERIGAPV